MDKDEKVALEKILATLAEIDDSLREIDDSIIQGLRIIHDKLDEIKSKVY